MDHIYQPFQQRARQLEFHAHDALEGHDHPTSHVLREEFRRLTEDFEQQRHPRSIEARMQTIERQLMQAEHSGEHLMNTQHTIALRDNVERMRRDLKKMPHY